MGYFLAHFGHLATNRSLCECHVLFDHVHPIRATVLQSANGSFQCDNANQREKVMV